MARKGYKAEQIIGKLREAEVLLNQGTTVGEASRKIGVTDRKLVPPNMIERWTALCGVSLTVYTCLSKEHTLLSCGESCHAVNESGRLN